MKNKFKRSDDKHKGDRPFGRSRPIWEIKTDLEEIAYDGVDSIKSIIY
jgi:hypothetical protein